MTAEDPFADDRHPDDCMCDQCRYERFKQAEAEDADFAPDRDDDGYPDSEADMDALAYQRGEDERDDQ